MNKKGELYIFDLDGTLFDTTLVNYKAYQYALSCYGYSIKQEYYIKNCNGRYYKDYLPQIIGFYDSELLKNIHELKKQSYLKYLKDARINRPLFRLVDKTKNDVHTAIVTSASRENCESILLWFDKKKCFDLIITQEDVKEKKPNPEGFLKAMKHFDISASKTVIFEDSETGIEAALLSGAQVFRCYGYDGELRKDKSSM